MSTTPAQLLELSEDDLIQLHHNCLLELLRRYPPSWPTAPAYNITRRIFETTRELHQVLSHTPPRKQASYPGLAVTNEQSRTP